jgi:signal peptidase II
MLQIIIIILAVLADQLSKFLLVPMFSAPGDTIEVIPGVFNLTYVQNQGASFGMLQGFQWFFIVITVIVLGAATWMMIKYRGKHTRFLKIAISLAYAGALGNLIDRILYGYVRDFFDFRMFDFWKWIFNVADACLVIGSIMLGVYILFIHKDKPKRKVGDASDSEVADAEELKDVAGETAVPEGVEKPENADTEK